MVEVIWPLSVVPCKSEGSSGRGVLPLRTYIEETLRRSRTSYSTLQVALYYLVLIKPFVPKTDFTQEQRMDCPASRALMCGRRMFLAALILASKYLQDRNYSAKAWSKMSGLKVSEINSNERTYLSKIDWKLHIREPIFKRWTEIVLKYTPETLPPSPGQSISTPSWRAIVPQLTAELDTVPIPDLKTKRPIQCLGNYGLSSPSTPTPTKPTLHAMQLDSTSHQGTPTPMTMLPRFLEPKPDMAPPTPGLAHMGPLPTPQLTPSSVAASTPAVSACGSRRPSMCSAMAMVHKSGFNRCAMDAFPGFPPNSRRPSVASAASTRSSPESMISDRSRSSRASSISSISTVSSSTSWLAPNRACLARQATCRSANLPIPPVMEEKEGTATKPIVISDDVEIISSPDMADFSISEKVLHAPHKHSKHAPQPTSTPTSDKSRKRSRPRGNRRSNLQEEVRQMLEEAEEIIDLEDEDDDVIMLSPSPAAECATQMLSRSNSVIRTKEVQPPATLSRTGSCRMPVQRNGGSKRACSSTSAMAMSISPVPLYGEVA